MAHNFWAELFTNHDVGIWSCNCTRLYVTVFLKPLDETKLAFVGCGSCSNSKQVYCTLHTGILWLAVDVLTMFSTFCDTDSSQVPEDEC